MPTGRGTGRAAPPGALLPIRASPLTWVASEPQAPHNPSCTVWTQTLAGPLLPAPPTTRPQGEESFLALQEAGAPLSGKSLPCARRSLPRPVHPTGLQPAHRLLVGREAA